MFQYRWQLDGAGGPTWLGPDTVRFRLWAPHGERLWIEFKDREPVELFRETDAAHFWTAQVFGVTPGDEYRVKIEPSWNDCYHTEGGQLFRRDPYARQTEFDSAWCFLTDPRFSWQPFEPPARNRLIIYEVHVGSFGTADHSLTAFENTTLKLDHIQALGFNCIHLMPVTEFGGIWGYNPRQLLAVHGKWGTPQQLKELIDRAHDLGMAVLLDIVLNHGSAKLNALWNWDGYGPHNNGGIYFEGERDTKWGRRFAFHKWEVKEYLKAACRMWIEEYNVDGLRFDSVHNMPWHLLQEMTHEIRHQYPGKFLAAEITPENPAVITDAGFDACWIHAAHFDSLKIMKGHDGGSDAHERLALLKSIVNLHPGFPRSSSAVNSVLGSHDQCGDRHNGHEDGGIHRYYVARLGGRNNWHARAQVRMWYGIQAMSRGLPMIFMGTETLQDEWWHVDEHHRFNWRLADGNDALANQTMHCIKDLNYLRLENPALTSENIRFVHEDPGSSILAWLRWSNNCENVLLCVANLGEHDWGGYHYAVATDWGAEKQWDQVFNAQAGDYGGWDESGTHGELTSDNGGRIRVNVPKWSVTAYQLR
jgi:1,4-alpha-glucan branching enzyme